MLITVLPESGKEVWGRGYKTPLPQNGLNDDGCCILGSSLHLEHPLEGIMWSSTTPSCLILVKGCYTGVHLRQQHQHSFKVAHMLPRATIDAANRTHFTCSMPI